MAVYIGSEKVKINLDGVVYKMDIYSEIPITNGTLLLTSDNYILKDSNGVYITACEEDSVS